MIMHSAKVNSEACTFLLWECTKWFLGEHSELRVPVIWDKACSHCKTDNGLHMVLYGPEVGEMALDKSVLFCSSWQTSSFLSSIWVQLMKAWGGPQMYLFLLWKVWSQIQALRNLGNFAGGSLCTDGGRSLRQLKRPWSRAGFQGCLISFR